MNYPIGVMNIQKKTGHRNSINSFMYASFLGSGSSSGLLPNCFVWEFSRYNGITEPALVTSARVETNFLGLLFSEMFVQSYDLRLLPQALCIGQQESSQGVGRKKAPLHLRPSCLFPSVCPSATAAKQDSSQTGQETPGTIHGPWRGACWHKEHKHQKC